MSVLDLTVISQPKDAADYVYQLLQDEGPTFGLENIEYDARLVNGYPAAVIAPGRKNKVLHSTGFFRVGIEVTISVYHAQLNASHRVRTRDDLILCEMIEAALEVDQLNWGNRVTMAFVTDTVPGLITRNKGEQVIGTRMTVLVDTREIMRKGG
jgi:hypothetical protein